MASLGALESPFFFRKRSIRTYIFLGIFLIVTSFLLWTGVGGVDPPEQPIVFRHDVHAGENKIPCLYCHAYARLSTVAGVPSVERCMGCHRFTATDHPGVMALRSHWENGEGIRWERIYSLPDYVYFSHKRHVKSGVQCRECHGPVEEMEVVRRYSSLEMGWCLDCHKKREASVDCLTCHK